MKARFRILIYQTMMDFRKRYLGTVLGTAWAVLSPLVTISLIYFVMTFGLRATAMGNVSFINWLVPGMLAWFFISEAIGNSCVAILENSYLVTKVVFPVRILPVSKVLASIPIHVLLMLVFMSLLLCEGTGQVNSWWQLSYYLFCGLVFCTAISFITSACAVFVRDTLNVVAVFIQIFFWATPIFWNPALIADTPFAPILWSPFNYILQGYRDSLFTGVYFWEKPVETIVFWALTLLITYTGLLLFKRSRPHFADVL